MINAISVINHSGEMLRCELANPELSGFAITNIDGLVPGKANIGVKEIATMDGGYFQNARTSFRNIVLSYVFLEVFGGRWIMPSGGGDPVWFESYRSIEDARLEFYKYFSIKKPITLIIETDRHTYQIDGYVESNEPVIFSQQEGAQVSIICPNPYFHLVDDGINDNGNLSEPVFNQGGSFTFPWSNPRWQRTIQFGNPDEVIRESIAEINYNGTVSTGIIIHIYAIGSISSNVIDIEYYGSSIENSLITTVRFNDMLYRASGGGLQAGDELIISTVPGQKYAVIKRSGSTINVFPYVQLFDDWISLQPGNNVFYIKPHATFPEPPNIYVTIEYPVLCLGV